MELNIPPDLAAEFDTTLRHCALQGAVRVNYSVETDEKGEKSSLKYYDSSGRPIGDDREYDILKSCFGRLTRLAERLIEDGSKNSNIKINHLEIDLDLISGHMSASGQ